MRLQWLPLLPLLRLLLLPWLVAAVSSASEPSESCLDVSFGNLYGVAQAALSCERCSRASGHLERPQVTETAGNRNISGKPLRFEAHIWIPKTLTPSPPAPSLTSATMGVPENDDAFRLLPPPPPPPPTPTSNRCCRRPLLKLLGWNALLLFTPAACSAAAVAAAAAAAAAATLGTTIAANQGHSPSSAHGARYRAVPTVAPCMPPLVTEGPSRVGLLPSFGSASMLLSPLPPPPPPASVAKMPAGSIGRCDSRHRASGLASWLGYALFAPALPLPPPPAAPTLLVRVAGDEWLDGKAAPPGQKPAPPFGAVTAQWSMQIARCRAARGQLCRPLAHFPIARKTVGLRCVHAVAMEP